LLKENHLRKESIFFGFGPFDKLRDPRPLSPSERRLLFNQSTDKHNRDGNGS